MKCTLVAVTALLITIGCTTRSAMREWEQKAIAIPLGTPRQEVEKVLPPADVVLDLRSTGGAAGPVAYKVDDTTGVKLWYDERNRLGRPVIVEQTKRPEATGTAPSAAITDLTIKDIGRPIVVVAKTPTQVLDVSVGSPQPPGLITTKGDTTVYRGQLSQIIEGGIMVRAPFPQTPDTFKAVGIMAKDIQSIQFTDK
jgi:hypothetical protein